MTDTFNLQRFVDAQGNGVFERAVAELAAGQKRSHWMWFVFPQARGLGSSPMARTYGVGSLDEARAYLDHPVLGPRLRWAAQTVAGSGAATLRDLFGSPDDMKFISSMTLFRLAEPGGVFDEALGRWTEGRGDDRTAGLVG
jgi:uncharacterized protein (DUF1810 family)